MKRPITLAVAIFATALGIAGCGSDLTTGAAVTTVATSRPSSSGPVTAVASVNGRQSFDADHPCAWLAKSDLTKLATTITSGPTRVRLGPDFFCNLRTSSFSALFGAEKGAISQLPSAGATVTDLSVNGRQGKQAITGGTCAIGLPATSSTVVFVQVVQAAGTNSAAPSRTQECAGALRLATLIEPHLPPAR